MSLGGVSRALRFYSCGSCASQAQPNQFRTDGQAVASLWDMLSESWSSILKICSKYFFVSRLFPPFPGEAVLTPIGQSFGNQAQPTVFIFSQSFKSFSQFSHVQPRTTKPCPQPGSRTRLFCKCLIIAPTLLPASYCSRLPANHEFRV